VAEDLGEKTEDPTPKRRQEARRKGQVPRSADLSAAVLLSAGILLVFIFGDRLLEGLAAAMRVGLSPETLAADVSGGSIGGAVVFAFGQLFRLVGPLLVIMAGVAFTDQIFQVGWFLSADPLKPNFGKLNVVSGFKKLVSPRSGMKGLLGILKLLAMSLVLWVVIYINFDRISALPVLTVPGALVESSALMMEAAFWCLLLLLLIGIIDRVYQKWQHTKDLRMTKQEVKEERKSNEGDMEMKARRQRFGRDLIRQQLQANVPQADVVVTNPTHFAVALKYDSEKMNAPRVLAKGADQLAMQIRLIAASSGVPIVERKPLARALYYNAEVGSEIPADLYEAVAELLAYVYRLDTSMAS